MKHPAPEEWMAWLYDEVTAPEKKALTAHLEACQSCQGQVAAWRSTMAVLDEMPAPVARKRFPAIPLQWAAMAALLIAMGIVLGRFVFPTSDQRISATMQQQIQQQVAAARADLAREFEQRQTDMIA